MRVVKYEMRYNERNKRYVIFEVPEKGRWKIKTSFEKRKDARDWIKAQKK